MTRSGLVTSPEPTGSLDGAGLLSDLADIAGSASTGSVQIGADLDAAMISALGVIDNPLGELLSAGVGWLLEHVWFLREPLDALAGDPAQIVAAGKTWAAIGAELTTIAAHREAGAANLISWQGPSAAAYQRRTSELSVPAIRAAALAADVFSRQMLAAGALIGTVRTAIRDVIADFVGLLIERAAIAVASSMATAGASVATFIATAVGDGAAVARRCIARIVELVRKLGELGVSLGRVRAALTAIVDRLGGAVTSVAGQALGSPTGKVLEVVVEAQKQAVGRYYDYAEAARAREP